MAWSVLIAASPGETRGALVDRDGRLVDLIVERDFASPLRGRLYRARVERVVPALDAAFLDLGGGQSAFLPRAEAANAPALRLAGRPPGESDRKGALSTLVAEGEALLVQIARDAASGKEPRATTRISLPGYHVVRQPLDNRQNVSKRIARKEERERLLGLAREIGGGLVVRSAATGTKDGSLRAEVEALDSRWAAALERARAADRPGRVDEGEPATVRMLRELAGPQVERVVTEGLGVAAAARACAAQWGAGWQVEEHRRGVALFEVEGVEPQIEAALARRVPLPGGGTLFFDRTEAATVVDVDTGGAGRGGRNAAILDANLAAAAEIGRQLRLRAVAGTVLVDFVRMPDAKARERVAAALQAAVRDDPAELRVAGFTALGLFELARSRERAPLAELMLRAAPEPAPSPAAAATAALRAAERAARADPGATLAIEAAPAVADMLEGAAAPAFAALAERLGGLLRLRRGGPESPGFAIVRAGD